MANLNWFLLAAVLVTAVAAWTDGKRGIIPNGLSLGVLVLAPVAHAAVGAATSGAAAALEGLLFSLAGALACGAVPMFLYMVGGGRGGDVKLLAALGALCRTVVGIEAVFYGFLVAAVFAQARLAYEGKLLRTLANTVTLVVNPFLPTSRRKTLSPEAMTWVRMGPSIFLGTVIAVLLNWSTP